MSSGLVDRADQVDVELGAGEQPGAGGAGVITDLERGSIDPQWTAKASSRDLQVL